MLSSISNKRYCPSATPVSATSAATASSSNIAAASSSRIQSASTNFDDIHMDLRRVGKRTMQYGLHDDICADRIRIMKRRALSERGLLSATEIINSERSLREAQTVKNSPPSEEEDFFLTVFSHYQDRNPKAEEVVVSNDAPT